MLTFSNIHGRKPGRGIRPWLVIPKYLFVALIVGGLYANCVLIGNGAPVDLIGRVYRAQIVPATALAMLLGIALFLQHPAVFWMRRWLRLKLILVALVVPGAHFLSWRALQAVRLEEPNAKARLIACLAGAFVAFAVIAVIGRLKPRLGQKYQ